MSPVIASEKVHDYEEALRNATTTEVVVKVTVSVDRDADDEDVMLVTLTLVDPEGETWDHAVLRELRLVLIKELQKLDIDIPLRIAFEPTSQAEAEPVV